MVEIRTLQSLPVEQRGDAARAIAGLVRHGGRVFVRCLARDEGETVAVQPWPVSRSELGAFVDAGLTELAFREEAAADGRGCSFTVLYAHP